MKIRFWFVLVTTSLMCALISEVALAGYGEGMAAYKNGDYATALKEWKPLAAQGNAAAQTFLGTMYANGQGVPQDYKEGLKWLRLAADQGDAFAQLNLAMTYENGPQGIPQDYKEAAKWYRLAADQGHAGAQGDLGWMYEKGQGVAANSVVAYALYNLSATNYPTKENPAIANRAKLTKSMTAKQVDAAQALTREMAKQGNLLKALDQYVKSPTVNEKN